MRRSYPEISATTGLWHTQHRTPGTVLTPLLLLGDRKSLRKSWVYVGVCVRSVATKTSLVNRLQLATQRQETHASSGHRAHCTVQRRTGHHHVVSTSHLHEDGEYCSFIETFIWISSTAVSLLSQDGHVPMLPAPVPTPAVRWLGWPVAALRTPAECGAFSMFRFLQSAAPACHLAPAPRTTRRLGQLAPGPGHTANA